MRLATTGPGGWVDACDPRKLSAAWLRLLVVLRTYRSTPKRRGPEVDPHISASAVKGLGFSPTDIALETSEADAAVVVGVLGVTVNAFLPEEQAMGESLRSRADDVPGSDIKDFCPQIWSTKDLEPPLGPAAPPIDGLPGRTEVRDIRVGPRRGKDPPIATLAPNIGSGGASAALETFNIYRVVAALRLSAVIEGLDVVSRLRYLDQPCLPQPPLPGRRHRPCRSRPNRHRLPQSAP